MNSPWMMCFIVFSYRKVLLREQCDLCWKPVVLRGVSTYVIPGRLRSYEDVHRYPNAGISVHATKGHAMDHSVVDSAQRRSTSAAERHAPAGGCFVVNQIPFTCVPDEGTRLDFSVGRSGAAECLATAGAMTAPCIPERRRYPIADLSAEALSGQGHCGARSSRFTLGLLNIHSPRLRTADSFGGRTALSAAPRRGRSRPADRRSGPRRRFRSGRRSGCRRTAGRPASRQRACRGSRPS